MALCLSPTSTEWTTVLTTALLLGFLALWYFLLRRRRELLPPGPRGLSVVQHVLELFRTSTPQNTLQGLSEIYGDVMSFNCFGQTVVVLGSHDAIRDAYVTQGSEFAGRPQLPFVDNFITKLGLILSEEEDWRVHRRFALSTLRDFGFGKLSLESRVQRVIEDLVDVLDQSQSRPIDLSDTLAAAAANVICSLLFDKNFKRNDRPFEKITNSIRKLVTDTSPVTVVLGVPLIRFIPVSCLPGIKTFIEATNEFIEVVTEIIDEHKETFDPSFLRDYVDVYLAESKMRESLGFTEDRLKAIAADLFVAGTETTSNTMYWLLRCLIDRPEIQKRIQTEIDEVIGRERFPSITDRSNMPYTEATIQEILRLSSIAPLSVFRSNTAEVKFRNYVIPKRSILMPNLWAVHYNPKYWPDPEKFDPERFLSADGKLEKRDNFMPFSVGKRFCLGETLARTELFLYLASILQRFNITLPDDDSPRPLTVLPSYLRRLQAYQLCAHPR